MRVNIIKAYVQGLFTLLKAALSLGYIPCDRPESTLQWMETGA